MSILLRVRTQLGVWRVQGLQSSDTLGYVRDKVESEHDTSLKGLPFTKDAGAKVPYDDNMTLAQAKLKHGDMIYATVDESRKAVHESSDSANKRITADGHIVQQDYSHIASKNGFRPGMLPLRSMKMAWTLSDFVAMDQQFEFKIKRQEQGICSKAVIDKATIEDFQGFMMTYDYRKMRVGYLYGRFNEDKTVNIEVIYEPPQDNTDTTFNILDDPLAVSDYCI